MSDTQPPDTTPPDPSGSNATLMSAQMGASILNQGLIVTCTSIPTLNGTYSCDDGVMMLMQDQMNALFATGNFSDGTQSLIWPDKTGINHTWPPTQFRAFGLACGSFRTACAQYALGITTVAPVNTVTIP